MAAITSAVVGVGGGIASSIQGFVGAAKQKKAAQVAEKEAKKFIADARRRAGQQVYDTLSIPMEAYTQEYEAQLQSDMQALQSLQEADSRALAGAVGKVGAQQTEEAAKTRTAMADEMFNLEKLKADEDEAVKQQLIALDAAEAQMADQRAYEAEQARQQLVGQGFKGITTAAETLGAAIEPFAKANIFKGKGAEGAAAGAATGASQAPGMAAARRFAPSLGAEDMAQGIADLRSKYMPTGSIFEFDMARRGGMAPGQQAFGVGFGLSPMSMPNRVTSLEETNNTWQETFKQKTRR